MRSGRRRMGNIGALVERIVAADGDLWLLALIGSFFVMVCESAKPRGEGCEEAGGWGLLVNILTMLTPLLLFLHAFASVNGVMSDILIAIIACIGGAVIGAALIGWLIGRVAPDLGRTLNRDAPFLAVP